MQVFLDELTAITNAPRVQRSEPEEFKVYKAAFDKWRAIPRDVQRDILFISELGVNAKHAVIREQECTRIDAEKARIIRAVGCKTNLFKWLATSVREPRLAMVCFVFAYIHSNS